MAKTAKAFFASLLFLFSGAFISAGQEVSDFKRGDIIIKPNHNWLPGTTFFEGGRGFGHAAIVLGDAKDTNTENLLKKTIIFESHARDVAEPDQLRRIEAYKTGKTMDDSNLSFSGFYKGHRYRLRPNLPKQQIDSIINFIVSHDDDISRWRSVKQYKSQPDYHTNHHWYCTLIIWQAYYDILGIDLDANKGLVVYPNDILNCSFFSGKGSITRF
jgi:hypothetical protein